MISANTVMIIVGIIVAIMGIVAFFVPAFARLINAPGGPRLKAIIALIIGIILVAIGLMFEIPTG